MNREYLKDLTSFLGVKEILQAFKDSDQEIRFVGGSVRDVLLGRPIKEIDFATTATPLEIEVILKTHNIKSIPTGITHGTVTAVSKGNNFEITTLRKDILCYGRHAKVEFGTDFAIDAERRDFTINAMSISPEGKIYDYFGGQEDLKKGLIKFVGNPRQRIREDALRILRYFRFLAEFGLSFEKNEDFIATVEMAGSIASLSGERIRNEIAKLTLAQNRSIVMRLIHEHHIWPFIFGNINFDSYKLELLDSIEKNQTLEKSFTRFLAILIVNNQEIEDLVETLKLSNKTKQSLEQALVLRGLLNMKDLPALSRKFSKDILIENCYIGYARGENLPVEEMVNFIESYEVPIFPIEGKDLLELGLKPGKRFGQILGELENIWQNENYKPDRNFLLEKAKNLIHNKN